MIRKFSIPFLAFLQASGFVVYLILISFFFNFVTPTFSKPVSEFYAPIVMLLLFVISAVISAVMILGRAGVLFWDKKYREAFTLVGWTVAWGLIYFALFIFILFLS
ncbi:hypothetical protein A2380_03730 [candidate division WWE3 bacterium RIFOXYB1_FULL_43_24]|uniref:Uncharacterized protein n=2 Tax=Katanobacteria TaxID=422282 RepID=A0A0G0YQX5_UNCKA|nr:MAG: hypothetical protein UU92_C0003G0003 [candidate division WWE3 bacterium GW2011_GWA1_42_12]KKS34989.1 MAG: hypothetical protein UU97_C0003G0003 [candidate division WWE3 bacterium GW2011_GWD1_42_14]KKS39077.1 MAG: hypothetical protein UV00_C0004G0003 [candidate division WWE3 bacterium GW2011_GWF1_42_14]KKS40607.1 MAG: hypothetical protein UV03_C0004G0003 [candidate division WWE3 bacterium GW2011_GWE1_42_16]KKS65807.1 MAG: hypothetical protein UV35_C0032G0010 [candidate division WWE3 bacte